MIEELKLKSYTVFGSKFIPSRVQCQDKLVIFPKTYTIFS